MMTGSLSAGIGYNTHTTLDTVFRRLVILTYFNFAFNKGFNCTVFLSRPDIKTPSGVLGLSRLWPMLGLCIFGIDNYCGGGQYSNLRALKAEKDKGRGDENKSFSRVRGSGNCEIWTELMLQGEWCCLDIERNFTDTNFLPPLLLHQGVVVVPIALHFSQV